MQRTRRPRIVRRLLPMVAAAAMLVPAAAGPAQAKLGSVEKAALADILEGMFDRRPTTTSLNCVSNRLPAGAIDDLLVDALAAGDDNGALADSIAFRKFFRATMACKPSELIPAISDDLIASGLTSRQRTCFAKNFMGRYAVDDALLTIAIRGGLQDLSFTNEDPITIRNATIALRGCVPTSQIPAIIADLQAG